MNHTFENLELQLRDSFEYGGENLYQGRAKMLFHAGMHLMLNYSGPEDSLDLFQELFAEELRRTSDPKVMVAISELLVNQHMSFDDWFYDLAFSRLLGPALSGELDDWTREQLPLLAGQLLHRGYLLLETRRSPAGRTLIPIPEA